MEENRKLWGLLRRRQMLVPTWRGCLVLLVLMGSLALWAVQSIHPFLTVTDPVPGGILVVEGWATDFAMEATVAEFRTNHYEKVFVTGGPIEWGAPLSEYGTYAEVGAATLVILGLHTNEVQAVPAPLVRQDRTYTAARALRNWLREHNIQCTQVHLITEGPHARRSRLLFQKALNSDCTVGVTAVPVRGYDPQRWWRSSGGVRA
ncbi:MAG TPA: ElyC/SanA/YdcF family protein, partial [Clostridia bacterium]|nr:ElyC/SanA/YdcF family protein [Clostridia bacterium]